MDTSRGTAQRAAQHLDWWGVKVRGDTGLRASRKPLGAANFAKEPRSAWRPAPGNGAQAGVAIASDSGTFQRAQE